MFDGSGRPHTIPSWYGLAVTSLVLTFFVLDDAWCWKLGMSLSVLT